MATLNGFNANQVEPAAALDPIPANKYLAVITESEMKPTKNGQGQYLQLTFQILDGPYKNRFLWARLNLQNANQLTVQIAKAELSAICRAVGVLTPQDSQELHHIPLVITVKLKKQKDTGELTNEIKGFAPKSSLSAPSGAAVQPAPAGAAAPGANNPSVLPANPYANSAAPWRR
jgi:hypothetical protein